MASFALFDDNPALINSLEDNLRKVTPELIQKTAQEYLRPTNRTVLVVEAGARGKDSRAGHGRCEMRTLDCGRHSRGVVLSRRSRETPPPLGTPKPFALPAGDTFTLEERDESDAGAIRLVPLVSVRARHGVRHTPTKARIRFGSRT